MVKQSFRQGCQLWWSRTISERSAEGQQNIPMMALGVFLSTEKENLGLSILKQDSWNVIFSAVCVLVNVLIFFFFNNLEGNMAAKTCTCMCSCRLKSYMALYSSMIFFRSTSERLTSTLSRVSSQVPWRCGTSSPSSDKCTTLQHSAHTGNTVSAHKRDTNILPWPCGASQQRKQVCSRHISLGEKKQTNISEHGPSLSGLCVSCHTNNTWNLPTILVNLPDMLLVQLNDW